MTIISNPSSSHQQQQHRKLKQQNNHHHASPTTTSSTISRSTDSATTTPPTSQSTHSIQFPTHSSQQAYFSSSSLELSSTQPSQDSADMTPAQKIARQVRISFSISQPSSSSIPTPTLQEAPTSTTHQLESDPNLTQPPLSDALTPAQAVAQQAHPASFCVISGRKGLPGDGHDRMAVVRPPTEISLTPERPVEPKIVKRTSKLAWWAEPSSFSILKLSSFLNTSGTDRSNSIDIDGIPKLNCSATAKPHQSSIIDPPTTSTILHHVSQAPPVATPSAPSIPLPIIPVAIFPTYSDEDDNNGSLEYSDGSPVVDSRELDPEEETDEEEDYDSNPLYIVLSTSLSPRLKSAYDSAKLQWIAAHTFVSASDSTNVASGSDTIKDQAKEGVEWVGIPSMKDKRVNLYLKPGSGIAEVRLTYIKPPSSQITPNKSTAVCKSPESVAPTDFSPIRPNLEGDPHRTIRAKAGPDDTDYHYHSSTFGESLTSPPPTSDPPPGIPIERPQLTGSKTSPALTNIIRSPPPPLNHLWHSLNFRLAGLQEPSIEQLEGSRNYLRRSNARPPIGTRLDCTSAETDCIAEFYSYQDSDGKDHLRRNYVSFPVRSININLSKAATHGHETQSPRLTPFENGGGLESALSGSKAKKGKEVEQRLRFKAPKWLRPGAAQKEREKEKERREKAVAVATARLREERDRELSLMTRAGTKLERVRLISLKSPVIECWWQRSVEATDQDEEAEVQGAQGAHIDRDVVHRTSEDDHRSSISLSQRSTLSSTYLHNPWAEGIYEEAIETNALWIIDPETSGTNKYRSVLGDFAFLLSPPEEFGAITCGILRKSVSKVWMHCHRFCETVVFLKGFESYILSQLKNEIYEPITNDIRGDLKNTGMLRSNLGMSCLLLAFFALFRGLSCHYASEDDYLDSILHDYRKRQIPLREFEIELPAALQDESLLTDAVEKLNQLRAYEGAYSTPSPLSPEILQRLFIAMDTADEQTVLNILMAKTPVECISIIKQTIDILVSVWKDVSTQAGMDEEAQRLTPDDLLALLASVILGIPWKREIDATTLTFTGQHMGSTSTGFFTLQQLVVTRLPSPRLYSGDLQQHRHTLGSHRPVMIILARSTVFIHTLLQKRHINTHHLEAAINPHDTLPDQHGQVIGSPMMDGGFGRSCSNPWDSSRSLSSIGEIVTDPSNNLGSLSSIQIINSSNIIIITFEHIDNDAIQPKPAWNPDPQPILPHPFSNGVDVQVVEGSSSPTEVKRIPVSALKTKDGGLGRDPEEPFLLGGAGRPNTTQQVGSLSTYSEFGNAKAERDSVASSDLRFRRTMTGSSLGHNSSSKSFHRNTTSTSTTDDSPNSDSVRTSARRGSVSSTCPSTSNMATRESFSLSTSSRSSELSSSLHHHHSHHHLQHHHRPTGPMTPAMEALSRARAASSLSIHRPPSSSPSSISIPYISRERDHNLSNHERVSSASSTTPSRSGDGNEGSQSTGMIPLRPILRPTSSASTSRLSLSVGPHSNSNSNSESPHSNHKENHNHNHLSLSLHHLSSHTSSTTSSSTTSPIDWNRSSSSLYTIH
ncbi:hypothetical protein H4Q26_011808 [Puccinia striiformis f. sp. tritici PST-130]|nr:hypothetical protein H4Q26_011808 [Puccinia striiformis f. sp. tritici PST-130]